MAVLDGKNETMAEIRLQDDQIRKLEVQNENTIASY